MPGDEYGNWKELADDLMPDLPELFGDSDFVDDSISSSPASDGSRRTGRMIILAGVLGHPIGFVSCV